MKRSAFLAAAVTLPALLSSRAAMAAEDFELEMSRLEVATHGRLGVAAIDTGTGTTHQYRGDERFPMCSTFKLLAVAAVLHRVDGGKESLDRHIAYGKSDLLEYAPVTSRHVADGYMTVEALCAAAIELSDNTAANLLLGTLGGPGAVTQYARGLGDEITRLDRTEPALNIDLPGDERDTTAPLAMARDMQKILLGDALSQTSRERLTAWLAGSQTGLHLLRAGVPAAWRAGDKSGMGGEDNVFGDSETRNDVAILWPPHGAPLIVAAYLTGCQLPAKQRDATLSAVATALTARSTSL
jgi:beta-lactamase class A